MTKNSNLGQIYQLPTRRTYEIKSKMLNLNITIKNPYDTVQYEIFYLSLHFDFNE